MADEPPKDDTSVVVESEPATEPDKIALREAQFFARDALRKDQLKQVLHSAIVWALRAAAFSVIALFVIRVWHLGAPQCWTWLDAIRLQQVDHLLFSGALGAFIMRYLQDILPKEKNRD